MITGDYVGDAFWSIFIFILGFDLYYFYKVKTYEEIIELYKNTPDKLALMIGRIYLFATFFLLLAWWYLYPEVHW